MRQALLASSTTHGECFDGRFQSRAMHASAQASELVHLPFMIVFRLTIGKSPNNGSNKVSRHGGEIERSLHNALHNYMRG